MTNEEQLTRLAALSRLMMNQQNAKIIVEPYESKDGFWFGAGNMVEHEGVLLLSGRYRNYGDSRSGLGSGERGLELALFASRDRGASWEKVLAFSKKDINLSNLTVLSIEGSALVKTSTGFELFVSSEKEGRGYAEGLDCYRKPGTGIWSIDVLRAESLEGLRSAQVSDMLRCDDPRYVHVKDPFVYARTNGDLVLGFCTHPYNWASSNTGYMVRDASTEKWDEPVFDHFPRGTTWDAGMTRATAIVDVPKMAVFSGPEKLSLLFYDGGEAVRNLDEHEVGVKRPRGYSCEELGGAAVIRDENLRNPERLSKYRPLFVSPMGRGTSRYVDVLETQEGFYVTWQQSQPDFSQPLVLNFVSREEVNKILTG